MQDDNTIKIKRPDTNRCEFTCRLTTDPIIQFKETRTSKKQPVAYVSFDCVCNSSPFNKKYVTFFTAFAWGNIAQELYDRLKKGYGIFMIGPLHCVYTRDAADGKPAVSRQAMFEIKEFLIRSLPADKEDKWINDAEVVTEPKEPL